MSQEARQVSRGTTVIFRVTPDILERLPAKLRDRLEDVARFSSQYGKYVEQLNKIIAEFHLLEKELTKPYTIPANLMVPIDAAEHVFRNRILQVMTMLELLINDVIRDAQAVIENVTSKGELNPKMIEEAKTLIKLAYKLSKLTPVIMLESSNVMVGLISLNAPSTHRPALARIMAGFDLVEVE